MMFFFEIFNRSKCINFQHKFIDQNQLWGEKRVGNGLKMLSLHG